MITLVFILAISAVLSSTTPPPNWVVQQKQCAEPGSPTLTCKGGITPENCRCSTQVKSISCDNWHGCTFDCGPNNADCTFSSGQYACKDHSCCVYDPRCQNLTIKPLRVPTLNPTPKPTHSPTIVCHVPAGGCQRENQVSCNNFNGCAWNFQAGVCQLGGCSGTVSPTPSPTTCTDQPLHGCLSLTSFQGCVNFSCCHWHGGSYRKGGRCELVAGGSGSGPSPGTTNAPVSQPVANCSGMKRKACKKNHSCRWAGRTCVAKAG